MRKAINDYIGMIAIAVAAVLVLGASGVRIDRSEEATPPIGIQASPVVAGNPSDALVDSF